MNTNDRIGHTPLILSDQVDYKITSNIRVRYQKTSRPGYFEFVSENFRLVRSGSELNYPETDFDNSKILFIVSLHFVTVNSLCSMHISTVLQLHGCTERVSKEHKNWLSNYDAFYGCKSCSCNSVRDPEPYTQ